MTNKINLAPFNYYGFDHEKVKETFKGDLTYIGSFCIKEEYTPRAFYFTNNPDRSKKHKDYMTLQKDSNGFNMWVSGIDKKDLEQYRYQNGLQCIKCNDIIYSIMRHDYRLCKCGICTIDGGREYTRTSGKYLSVIIDLIDGIWTETT